MSDINKIDLAPTTPNSTQRMSSKTRVAGASLVGGTLAVGAGAAATYYLGASAVVSKVGEFVQNFLTVPQLASVPYLNAIAGYGTLTALGSMAAGIGGALGAAAGKFTAHKVSLNDVKAQLGIAGSDLNFSQIRKVADIAVKGGIFMNRSTVAISKNDATRMRNLNRILTKTEHSLSSNAHAISKARGVEDRFFHFEGARLASRSQKTSEFIEAKASLKAAIEAEVKATDKYTYILGNSASSISRREYILTNIMGFAHERSVAGNFLSSAVRERAETATTNPKLAEANFRQALKDGMASEILAPNADGKCYEGMVKAGVEALRESKGKNPDAVLSSLCDSFKDAGLLKGNLRARFIKDVHQKIANPQVQIADPNEGSREAAMVAKESVLEGQPVVASPKLDEPFLSAPSEKKAEAKLAVESGLPEAVQESSKEKKARLAREANMQANDEVATYSHGLANIIPLYSDLADSYQKLLNLLNEKQVPLNQIMEMGPRRLRGALALRHKENFDLFERYEANDAAIHSLREKIALLSDQIEMAKAARPNNFKRASENEKTTARDLEHQIKKSEAQIRTLSKEIAGISEEIGKIEGKLDQYEGRANTFLFPATEETLSEPALPKQPGFFDRFFKRFEKENQVPVEEPLVGDVQIKAEAKEEPLTEPAVVNAETETALPEPVVISARPRWRLWG